MLGGRRLTRPCTYRRRILSTPSAVPGHLPFISEAHRWTHTEGKSSSVSCTGVRDAHDDGKWISFGLEISIPVWSTHLMIRDVTYTSSALTSLQPLDMCAPLRMQLLQPHGGSGATACCHLPETYGICIMCDPPVLYDLDLPMTTAYIPYR